MQKQQFLLLTQLEITAVQKWAAITKVPHHREVSEGICFIMIAINEPEQMGECFWCWLHHLLCALKVYKGIPESNTENCLEIPDKYPVFGSSSGKVRTGASILITLLAVAPSLSLYCIVLHCIAFPLVWSSLSSCF